MKDVHGPLPPKLPASAADPLPSLADQVVELSVITGGLAHEIRNSLSTLRMNLQLLAEDWQRAQDQAADGALDAEEIVRRSRSRIGVLSRESERLEGILEDFLRFVSKRELRLSRCDLSRLVGEMSDFYRPQAQAHEVAMTVVSAAEPLICEVDENLMKQALLNLMINAQQSMTEGGSLTVQLSAENDRIARIDVIDTGPGIAQEQLPRVFDAYFSTKKRGTGLGLTTTRQIVREHGGRIHVHSETGHGTCFSILLQRVKDGDGE